jgi:hypothetical protein
MSSVADLAPSAVYPERGRTTWIVAQRPGVVRPNNPNRPQGVFLERERLANGEVVDSGVVLLTNRECPWRCLMCDLWKETMVDSVPAGAIPQQIDFAREQLANLRARPGKATDEHFLAGPWPTQLKLYNSGSFFDPGAIPFEDYEEIARRVAGVRNVVVESHPRLVGDATLRWRDLRGGENFEVAMGLETAHPSVLERLNKKFDLAQFARAAEFLRSAGIALRVFLLVRPPFLDEEASIDWTVKSAEFAFDCGASAVSLIATRAGNGALERLRESGEFSEPRLATLEAAQDGALALRRGRVFADTWGTERFSSCPHCWPARRDRIDEINLTQTNRPRVTCAVCAGR